MIFSWLSFLLMLGELHEVRMFDIICIAKYLCEENRYAKASRITNGIAF